jgi:hypothetical protein
MVINDLAMICCGVCVLAVTEALMAPGKVEGSSGTRNLQDNLSDLSAQVAANQKVYSLSFYLTLSLPKSQLCDS